MSMQIEQDRSTVTAWRRAAMAAVISLLLLAVPRLRADGPATMDRNYLVELNEAATAVDDPTSVATELAKTYGGHPAVSEPGRGHGLTIAMSAEEARLLASDPRVKAVRETTAPSAQSRRIIANDLLAPITVGPYKYDGAGNIIHMGTDRYTYDEMSRITSGTAVTAQNADTQQFDYDGFGNLKKVTVPNKNVVYIDSDPSTNRLRDTYGSETGTNVLHFWGGGYDASGNQQSWNGTPSYVYDSMNMLSEMTSPRHEFYLYDANDERVATVSYTDSQNAVWRYTLRDEGNHVLRVVTDTILSGAHSWQQTEDYVYRTGGLLAAITPQGTTETRKHFHLDHLGSAVLITDDNGQRVSSHKYWPFGAEAPGSDTDNERMKFTGHERDLTPFDPNGLDYMHARYYSSITGRFLSVDLAGGDPYSPQTWNRYSYARNNPLNRVDLDGNADTWFQRAAAATIAFGSSVQAAGAQLNNGSALGTALDATVGTAGSIVQGYGDALNLGTSAGEVIGNGGGDAYDIGMAASAEIGRACTIIGTVASIAQTAGVPSTVIRGTTVPTADGPVPVRAGMVRSVAENGRGVVYRPAGETGNAGVVRVAGADARNPAGYARAYNKSGQPTVVSTGRPGPNAATHPALTGAATTTPVKAVVPPAPCQSGTAGCSK